MENPLVLRAALQYISMFQGSTFVIKINGDLVKNDFLGIAQDIALLHALGIKVVVVFGCQQQIEAAIQVNYGKKKTVEKSGYWVTDPEMLEVIKGICTTIQLEIVATLTSIAPTADIFTGNVIRAKRRGVVDGTDFQLTGEVDTIKSKTLQTALDNDMITVISPLATNKQGEILHLMSDEVATSLTIGLRAKKLIFMTSVDGIYVHSELIRQIEVDKMAELVNNTRFVSGNILFKAQMAIRACQQGIPRTHIINGKRDGALLLETFSRDGIGTLIYSDTYAEIRPALPDDIPSLVAMAKPYVAEGTVINKTVAELTEVLDEIMVFEKDHGIVGCCRLTTFEKNSSCEISYLVVDQSCRHQNIATKLLEFAENKGRDRGLSHIFALTTRAESWFVNRQFRKVDKDMLPASRRETYDENRRSKVMLKQL